MNLNDLILEISLKIKRNLEYIKLHSEIHDFFLILSTNLKTIKEEFENQENKTNLETKKYYTKLINFYETEVLPVKDLLENNNLFDNSNPSINQELNNKIKEIENCIKNFEIEYQDNNLLNYIKNKYQNIINNYQYELKEYLNYRKNSLINSLKKDYQPNLSLYTDINFLKQKYLNELTLVLDDFIKYLNSLTDNKKLIQEKETNILNNLTLIKEKLNFNLLDDFLKRKEEYNNSLDNYNLENLKIGEYQNKYINYLISLENEIQITLLYLKNQEIIKDLETNIQSNIKEINNYLNTNLDEEFSLIKTNYENIISSYTTYDKNSILDQQTYLNKLDEFQKGLNSYQKDYQISKQANDYVNYLTNTNPLLIRYKMLEEIEIFLSNNPNKELENILNRTYYLFLLLEFVFNKHQKLENLTHKEKLLIEKYFLIDMENFDKSKHGFYLDYLKNGLKTDILLKFTELIIDKEELLKDSQVEDFIKKYAEKKWKKVEYNPIITKKFQNNIAYIKTTKYYELFRVNKNGDVSKIDIPNDWLCIDYLSYKNNILVFQYCFKGHQCYNYNMGYITNNRMILGNSFNIRYSLTSGTKFLVKKDNDTFLVLDANDLNYEKTIYTETIINFLKSKKLIIREHYIGSIDFIENTIIFSITYYIKNKPHYIYVNYDLNTKKITLLKKFPINPFLNDKLDEEELENYSLFFDGDNYQFVNLEKELDCPYMRIINKTHEIVVNNNLKTKKIDYKNYKKK